MTEGPDLIAAMEALLGEIEVERAQAEAEHAEWDRQRAEAARNGEMGPEWQTLQRRIDAGQTTVADVMNGTDDSAEATRVRGYADQHTTEMAETMRADPVLAAEREANDEAYRQLLRDTGHAGPGTVQ